MSTFQLCVISQSIQGLTDLDKLELQENGSCHSKGNYSNKSSDSLKYLKSFLSMVDIWGFFYGFHLSFFLCRSGSYSLLNWGKFSNQYNGVLTGRERYKNVWMTEDDVNLPAAVCLSARCSLFTSCLSLLKQYIHNDNFQSHLTGNFFLWVCPSEFSWRRKF